VWREEKAVEWGEGIGVVSVGEITGRGDRNKKKVEREREEREIRGKGGQERREGRRGLGGRCKKIGKKKRQRNRKDQELYPQACTPRRARSTRVPRARGFAGFER